MVGANLNRVKFSKIIKGWHGLLPPFSYGLFFLLYLNLVIIHYFVLLIFGSQKEFNGAFFFFNTDLIKELTFISFFHFFSFMLFSFFISVLILNLYNYLIPKEISLNKMLGYECGYDPFEDARQTFNVQFYLVGILFLIFDLEIAFIFPWAINIAFFGLWGLFLSFFFLIFIGLGFIFEFKKGALYW